MILVAGATGSLGSRIALALLESGEQVRALVRSTSDYTRLEKAGAGIAVGDLKDAASLERACRDVDVVITTASASRRADDSLASVDLRGNQHLIDAAERMGVAHYILVSAAGASPDSPAELFRAKGLAEQRLRESGMVHTILQPAPFMDVWFAMIVEMPIQWGQPVTLVGEGRHRHAFIAEQDVAAIAVAATCTPAARNATIPIGGPEAVSWQDVVRAYGDVIGREIPVRSVPPGAPIPGVPEQVWGIAASLESFESIIPMDDTSRLFGVSLTSAAAFARARLAIVAH